MSATEYLKTTFPDTPYPGSPSATAAFFNYFQDFLAAIASGGGGSVVRSVNADSADSLASGAMVTSADNYRQPGTLKTCSSGIAGGPWYGLKDAAILVVGSDTDHCAQYAMSLTGSRAIKLRQYSGGVWTGWSEVGAGGSGSVSYLPNGTFEDDTSGWTGSAGLSISRTTTAGEVLEGVASLKLSKASGNQAGALAYAAFSLPLDRRNSRLRIGYDFLSLAGYVADGLQWELYDSDNSMVIPVDVPSLPAGSGSGSVVFQSTAAANYTLRIKVGTTDTAAWNYLLDNATIGPWVLPSAAAVGTETAWTPTTQGFTVTSATGSWSRVGGRLLASGRIVTSAASAVEARIYFPDGLVASSSPAAIQICGSISEHVSSRSADGLYVEPGAGYVVVALLGSSTAIAKLNGNAVVNAGGIITFKFEVPIAGWGSNINLITDFQEFASNTSTADADDLSSFSNTPYGSGGIIGTTNLSAGRRKRVRFTRPIMPKDSIEVVLFSAVGGMQCSGDMLAGGTNAICTHYMYRSTSGGILWNQVNSTDVDVWFLPTADGITAWNNAAYAGIKWALVKTSGGNAAEAPASGIYASEGDNDSGWVKYVDGRMEVWGWDYVVGNGSGTTFTKAISFSPAVFIGPPGVEVSVIGSYSGTPTTPGDFSSSTSVDVNSYGATTAGFTGRVAGSAALGNGVAYGFVWKATGRWNAARSVVPSGMVVGDDAVLASYKWSTGNWTANQPINFDTVVEDVYGAVTTGASWKFTCPAGKAGVYLISGLVYAGSSTADIYVYKNGVQGNIAGLTTSGTVRAPISQTVRLAVGDYIDLRPNGSVNGSASNIQITRISN